MTAESTPGLIHKQHLKQPQDQQQLRVELVGFSPRTANTLTLALNGPVNEYCTLSAGDDAQSALFNMDDNAAPLLLGQYRQQHPERPLLLVSSGEPALGKGLFLLRKPIVLRELIDGLLRLRDFVTASRPIGEALAPAEKTVAASPTRSVAADPDPSAIGTAAGKGKQRLAEEQQMHKLVCGSSSDIDLADHQALENLRRSTALTLLEVLQKAVRQATDNRQALQVFLHGKRLFAIIPERGVALGPTDEPALILLCRRRIGNGAATLQKLDNRELESWQPEVGGTLLRADIESWLWKIALWTYRGKLPEHTDPGSRVYLRHLPNFTRLMPVPHAKRIAALWRAQSVTLEFTAKTLRIPQRYVFAFYSAAFCIGMAGPARRESDYLFAQQPAGRVGHRFPAIHRRPGGNSRPAMPAPGQ